jgi:hypothetical protein
MRIIQNRKNNLIKSFTPLLIIAALIALFILIAGRISIKSEDEGLYITSESLRRAVVNCYVLEGVYPQSLDYLKAHYGVRPNEDKYLINYDYIASNLMPDITVLPSIEGVDAYIH